MSEKKLIITSDGSHTIFLPELNETYHSRHGAIRESEHVFIDKGLGFYAEAGHTEVFIREVGFGTGLNALLAWQYAQEHDIVVMYQSIEAHPLDLEAVHGLNYPSLISGEQVEQMFRQIHDSPWERRITLSDNFMLHKIQTKLQDFEWKDIADVCFFDAFAPSKQPEMWEIGVLELVRDALCIGGVFVTYCAKGQLKRDLRQLGFDVESLPGPPGKKEMVRAIRLE
jgi:tRNA U34 5-methylaminomethyl-2-thiouridine-forming methyltransferase MnmC